MFKELHYGLRKLYLQMNVVSYVKGGHSLARYEEQKWVLRYLLTHPGFTFKNKTHENKYLRLLNRYVRNDFVYNQKKKVVKYGYRTVKKKK